MTKAADDDSVEREKLDGRVAFAAAAFLLAYAFVALLDRVGAPIALVETAAPYFTILALGALGAMLHSMRASYYYTAGRAVPAEYAGFAKATLVAGVIAPFAAYLVTRPWLIGVCGGLFAGVALTGYFLGPILRKSGAFSLSGLLGARFPGLGPRLAIIGLACASSALVALAAQQSAVDALTGILGSGRGFAAVVIGVGILAIAGRPAGHDLDGLRGWRGRPGRLRLAGPVARVARSAPFQRCRRFDMAGGGRAARRLGRHSAFLRLWRRCRRRRRDHAWSGDSGAFAWPRDHDAETVKCAHGGLRRLRLDLRLRLAHRRNPRWRHAILDAPGCRRAARAIAWRALHSKRSWTRDHLRSQDARSIKRAAGLRRQGRGRRRFAASTGLWSKPRLFAHLPARP